MIFFPQGAQLQDCFEEEADADALLNYLHNLGDDFCVEVDFLHFSIIEVTN